MIHNQKCGRVVLETGVTLLEYVVVVSALGLLFVSYYYKFAPKSSAYYSDIVDGLDALYPRGYYNPSS